MKYFLKKLVFPLTFLSFNSYSNAVPLYDGTRTYQPMLFQYAFHTLATLNPPALRTSFIASGQEGSNPLLEFAASLKEKLPTEGHIIIYDELFSKWALRDLGKTNPEYAPWIEDVIARTINLYDIFKEFRFYSPKQHGNLSFRAVLTALIGENGVSNSLDDNIVGIRFFKSLSSQYNVSPEDVRNWRSEIFSYCVNNSLGMLKIVKYLSDLVSKA